MIRRGLPLISAALILLAGAPAAGGTRAAVRTDAIYQSTGRTAVTLVPVGTDDEGTLMKLDARFRCEEQRVQGDLLVSVDDDGEFEVETTSFVSSFDVGSDTEVTVSGRITRRAATGTIDANVRAYDNAGTTAECDREIKWRARATEAPALEGIDGFVETGEAGWIAAADEAVYVGQGPGLSASIVRRLDPETGDEVWQQEVDAIEELAAGSSSVWGVDAGAGLVLGFAAADGEPVGELEVAGEYDAIASTADSPVAVTSDAVWVGLTPDRVVRLDPDTGEVVAEIEIDGDPEGDVNVVATDDTVVVAVEKLAARGDEGIPLGLTRIDPASNTVVAEAETVGQLEGLAIAGDIVTIPRFDESTLRFDVETLEETDELDVEAFDVLGVGTDTWIATDDGLLVIDETGETVLELPGVTGNLATDGTMIYVLDSSAEGFVRFVAATDA